MVEIQSTGLKRDGLDTAIINNEGFEYIARVIIMKTRRRQLVPPPRGRRHDNNAPETRVGPNYKRLQSII